MNWRNHYEKVDSNHVDSRDGGDHVIRVRQ